MAKSLRSKWRRKCKAIKRERYGAKELARLKKTLGIDENAPADSEMNEISEVATVVDAEIIKEAAQVKAVAVEKLEEMDEDGKRIFNPKTLRDQHGNYPIWMNKRKILKNKKGRTRAKKNAAKKTKRLRK